MRKSNSVGGYRLYPTSPEDAEIEEINTAVLGQFNDGMDRLNRERELSQREQQLIDQLGADNQLAWDYQSLRATTNQLWRLALQKQQQLNEGIIAGPYSTNQLGLRLIDCANNWQQFKRNLEG